MGLFLPALQQVSSLGMRSEVFTCGVVLQRKALRPVPQALIATMAAIENLKLVFSFHGADAEVHDAITTVHGSFDCTVASLNACLAAGLACDANFVPLKPNVHALEPLSILLAEKGVSKLSILRFVPQGRGLVNVGDLLLSPGEEEAFLETVVRLRERKIMDIRTGSPFNGMIAGSEVPCRAGAGKIVIQPDGNVLPCEVFKQAERRAWELNINGRSLQELLHATSLRRLRESLELSGCMACPVHGACGITANRRGKHELSRFAFHP